MLEVLKIHGFHWKEIWTKMTNNIPQFSVRARKQYNQRMRIEREKKESNYLWNSIRLIDQMSRLTYLNRIWDTNDTTRREHKREKNDKIKMKEKTLHVVHAHFSHKISLTSRRKWRKKNAENKNEIKSRRLPDSSCFKLVSSIKCSWSFCRARYIRFWLVLGASFCNWFRMIEHCSFIFTKRPIIAGQIVSSTIIIDD